MKKYLTTQERIVIEWEIKKGTSLRQIAKQLGKHHSTIIYEVKKKSYRGEYMASYAKEKTKTNMSSRGVNLQMSNHWDLLIYLEEHYDPKYNSIDVVLKEWRKNHSDAPSLATIYNWIPRGALGKKDLLRPKQYKETIKLWKKMLGRPISLREIEQNMDDIGHWEGDFIVGGQKKEKGYILTLVEKKTRFAITQKFETKNPSLVFEKVQQLLNHFNQNIFKSITFDNGVEFCYLPKLEEVTPTKIYFAFPYSSWQRGQNENWNGLFRRAFPKGTDFNATPAADINLWTDRFNNMPRKILNYKTSRQLFETFLEENNYSVVKTQYN